MSCSALNVMVASFHALTKLLRLQSAPIPRSTSPHCACFGSRTTVFTAASATRWIVFVHAMFMVLLNATVASVCGEESRKLTYPSITMSSTLFPMRERTSCARRITATGSLMSNGLPGTLRRLGRGSGSATTPAATRNF